MNDYHNFFFSHKRVRERRFPDSNSHLSLGSFWSLFPLCNFFQSLQRRKPGSVVKQRGNSILDDIMFSIVNLFNFQDELLRFT